MAPWIEFLAVPVISVYVIRAWWALLKQPAAMPQARQLVAQGALMGLSLVLAATVLKTILVSSLAQIGKLAAILTLRTLLGHVFAWEQQRFSQARP